jgi:hypothetical protein
MSSRITTVKDFYDLYISEINYVFREMHRKNWFKCYFWDDESVLQFEILDSIIGNRYWNSFIVMPEVAGVRMSDILTELVDNHTDVDELCQISMNIYIERLEQVLPDGHAKDLFIKSLRIVQSNVNEDYPYKTLKICFSLYKQFIKVYEFSGSDTDLSFREFCKENQPELNRLTQEFKVSRTHDTGDKLFKFCMSNLEDGEIQNLGLTVFFSMSSRKILGDAYVDQVNHVIEYADQNSSSSIEVLKDELTSVLVSPRNLSGYDYDGMSKPKQVSYNDICDVTMNALSASYLNNRSIYSVNPMYLMKFLDSTLRHVFFNRTIAYLIQDKFDEQSTSYFYTTYYALMERICSIAETGRISFRGVASFVFILSSLTTFSKSASKDDFLAVAEKIIYMAEQNRELEDEYLVHFVELVEHLAIESNTATPTYSQWLDNLDVIVSIDPKLVISMISDTESKKAKISGNLQKFRRVISGEIVN